MAHLSSPRSTDVLIAGAGPTGLVLALWLTRQGVRVRIVDKAPAPGTTSRALAVQARTLEFYAQLGLAAEVVGQGRRATEANLWVNGKRSVHIDFHGIGTGISPFPNPLIYPQDEHERLLIRHLAEAGVTVERDIEVLGFEEFENEVRVRMRKPDAGEETCVTAYLAGCDGAHSTIREKLGIGFPGGTYEHLFYVADVEASGPTMNGDLHFALERSDFLVVFPLKGDRRARFIGTIRESQKREKDLSWDDVASGVVERLRTDVRKVNWFSTYRVHHRVADRFRSGRCFLLGDAAHIHSPVGGQGMNTGIGDAVNLAWKLAEVVRGRAAANLLDSYEPERMAFAQRLVETTDRAFTAITTLNVAARLVRLRIAPIFIPVLFSFRLLRLRLFRTVSQVNVNYRGSDISKGTAGTVHGGDRLPWIRGDASADPRGNFAVLQSLAWQVHVYGDAAPALREFCLQRKIALHVFAWSGDTARAGLRRNALYLIRPDGYVALADTRSDVTGLASYLDQLGLTPGEQRANANGTGESRHA